VHPGFFYGLLLSSYAFSQFLAAPFLGKLSDAYGRKSILLISQLGTAIGWALIVLSTFIHAEWYGIPLGFALLIFARIVDGLTGGNISVAQAWISDVAKPEERTKLFGMQGALFGIGFMIGPLVGGVSFAITNSMLGPALISLALSIVTLFLLEFGLSESLPQEKRTSFDLKKVNLLKEINIVTQVQIIQNPLLRKSFYLRAGFSLAFSMFTTTIVILMEDRLGFTPEKIGLFMGVIGIFSILNQGFVIPRAAKKLHDVSYFFGSIVIAAFALGLLPLTFFIGTETTFFVALIIMNYCINFSLASNMTVFKTLISKHSEGQRGFALSIDNSMMSFGNGVAPLIAGSLFAITDVWLFSYAGVLLLMLIIAIYIWTKQERVHHTHGAPVQE
jgi:DHA1 family tetracycline resistance protein-like MFS transporter